jgi:hypothetical protein
VKEKRKQEELEAKKMKVVRRHQGFHRREGNKQEKETAVENEL